MIQLFNFLFPWLIEINQNNVLDWFGGRITTQVPIGSLGIESLQLEPASVFSLEALKLLIQEVWLELQDGICLADIDNAILFIVIIRFVLLKTRYNTLTSAIITGAGLAAAYFWYTRIISLITTYEKGLYRIPYAEKLIVDSAQIKEYMYGTVRHYDHKVRLTNPVGIFIYAFTNGSMYQGHSIDPVSMLVTKVSPRFHIKYIVESIYYLMYRKVIPETFRFLKMFYRQFSAILIYTFLTRINKRYCPYVIRWHWTTFLVLAGMDRLWIHMFNRTQYYLENHILPGFEALGVSPESMSFSSINGTGYENFYQLKRDYLITEWLGIIIVSLSIGLTFSLLFHAICGQYVYIPFITENVEMHVGFRPKNSVYSAGLTAWQEPEEYGQFKIWYGWFGRGTVGKKDIMSKFKRYLFKRFRYLFKTVRNLFKF